jgi:large subunit ribosomal protein L6
MSRIGKLPIEIPKGVKIKFEKPLIQVEGPMGMLTRNLMDGVAIQLSDSQVIVSRDNDGIKSRSAHGLTRTLINNMVTGVTKGFQTGLEISGVGYRAEVKGDILNLSLGYSHPINFPIPIGITIEVEKMT